MKVVFDENFFDEIDHFHPNFDESVPNQTPMGSRHPRGLISRLSVQPTLVPSLLFPATAGGPLTSLHLT